MIIQRYSLRTKNKTCSKEYSLLEYIENPCNKLKNQQVARVFSLSLLKHS